MKNKNYYLLFGLSFLILFMTAILPYMQNKTALSLSSKAQDNNLTIQTKEERWKKAKKDLIDDLVKVRKIQMVDMDTMKKNNIIWQEGKKADEKWLENVNNAFKKYNLNIRLKRTYQDMLDYCVARYREILKDPYQIKVDLTKDETDQLIAKFADMTGVSEDIIKTIGLREGGLRHQGATLHGDEGAQDGILNVFAHQWKKHPPNNTIGWGIEKYPFSGLASLDLELLYFNGQILPIPSNVEIWDSDMNIAYGLAILMEHLEQVMTADIYSNYREFMLYDKSDFFYDKEWGDYRQADIETRFAGMCFEIYHFGLYLPTVNKNENNLIRNELFTDLKTNFQWDYHPILMGMNTWTNRSWELFIFDGEKEASGLRFYSLQTRQEKQKIREQAQKEKEERERKEFQLQIWTQENKQTIAKITARYPELENLSPEEVAIFIADKEDVISLLADRYIAYNQGIRSDINDTEAENLRKGFKIITDAIKKWEKKGYPIKLLHQFASEGVLLALQNEDIFFYDFDLRDYNLNSDQLKYNINSRNGIYFLYYYFTYLATYWPNLSNSISDPGSYIFSLEKNIDPLIQVLESKELDNYMLFKSSKIDNYYIFRFGPTRNPPAP